MSMMGKTLGKFECAALLGKGGMGEVYRAKDQELGRDVAIKVLPEEFAKDTDHVARFQREAKLLASLNHPNIAAIYGLEQAEGKRFIVMELVEGETLAKRLSKGRLPLDESLGLCRQIAEGLEAAHEKGVIHRDLKPANVMITEGDKVKILDFGLAKALSGETQSSDASQSPTVTESMTQPGTVLGTAAYMSPEQAKGKAVDRRADIWAFGCILYECLTGRRAFEGHTATETLASILKNEPDWQVLPNSVPPGIKYVLQRCLSKEASQRFHHAADVRIQMEDTRKTDEAPAPAKSRWTAWTVAMAGILAAAWLAFVHFREEPAPPAPLIRFQIPLPDKVNLAHGSPFVLSPNGRYLAFIAKDSEDVERIWIRALDSLEARSLSGTESNRIFSIYWSPDSRFIAFDSGSKLKRIDILGGPHQVVCDIPPTGNGGSWNSDGRIFSLPRDQLLWAYLQMAGPLPL